MGDQESLWEMLKPLLLLLCIASVFGLMLLIADSNGYQRIKEIAEFGVFLALCGVVWKLLLCAYTLEK